MATRATAGLYDSCSDVLFDAEDDDCEVLIRWHRIPFISKIISGFTCIVDRTGCGISSLALPSSDDDDDDDGDRIAFEKVVALSSKDVPVRTSVLIIVDSFHCCLHCSNFRRFFSFRDNLNSTFATDALSFFSTVQLVSADLIILTASVDSIRSMICKAHLSNLHGRLGDCLSIG